MNNPIIKYHMILANVGLIMATVGCNLPAPASQQNAPDIQTAAALTVQAVLTPLSSPTSAGVTPVPSAATFTLNEDTNCRKGPGTNFALVTTVPSGMSVQLVARYADADFWVVAPPGLSEVCWISGEFGTASGNFESLPVVTPSADLAGDFPARPGSFFYSYSCPFGSLTTDLTWTDSADNETGYRLYRYDVLIVELPANSTGYTDETTVIIGGDVTYTVEAFNSAGASAQRTVNFNCQ